MQPPPSHHRRAPAILAVVLGLFAAGTTANAANPSRWETLEAIHRVENPHNLTTPGPRGELGAYQFRQETWRHYTSAPFNNALDRQASDAVALKHYDWIRTGLINQGIDPSVYNIALAWNAGIGAVARGTAPAVARDYASRVTNIARGIHSENVALAAAKPAAVAAVAPSRPVTFTLGALRMPTSGAHALTLGETPARPVFVVASESFTNLR